MELIHTKYTICTNCPCLNCDTEEPAKCNLGFETRLEWVHFQSGKIRMEHPGDKIEDYKLEYLSPNCQLESIRIKDKPILLPVPLVQNVPS